MLAVIALALGMFTAAPAEAQNVVWRGEYYNNAFLQDPPTFTRNDNAINFNWGLGSPGNGINADNFSVRWATDVSLAPGTYRFYAQADDNVRVTFNFNTTVIDTFANPAVGQLVSGDVNVPSAGTYHIQVDYREVVDTAFAFVSFANLATNPNPPGFPVNPGVGMGQWVAYYYPNTSLSGDPAAILTVPTPNFNTGGGAPVPSVPATNWSARFTSVQSLTPGGYQATFNVDDGVRYFVNGALVLDRFSAATGQPLTANFTVPAQQTTFQIDYVQFGGEAYMQYNLAPIGSGGGQVITPPVTDGPFATARVTAGKLNVRAQPTVSAPVVTQVRFNEQYPVFGKSADNRWYLIDVFGTFGWASGGYLRIDQPLNVPVVDGNAPAPQPTAPPATGEFIATATPFAVNVRSGPGTEFRRLATMPSGATATIIGRNANNTWWQVDYAGIVGWASAQYAVIQQNANVDAIPITG
jgi:uncharacterized protein YraI